jgi:hypothetical protein
MVKLVFNGEIKIFFLQKRPFIFELNFFKYLIQLK